MNKLRALRYFQRAAELQSFSAAAKEFDVPASSISRRIKDLEQELGIELLQRSTRHVGTTELGSIYLEMITEVLQKLDDADELLSQRLNAVEGKIRISAMPSFGEKVLAPILQEFRQAYPAITLELDFSDDLTILAKDPVDIAIRAGKMPEERVVAKRLGDSRFKLVATPQLVRALQARFDREVLSINNLEQAPTLQYSEKYKGFPWWTLQNGQWLKIDINSVFRSNNGEALLAATLASEGVSLFPVWWIRQYLDEGRLIELPTELPVSNQPNASLDIFLLYQQAKYKIPKVKLCIDFILRRLAAD